VYFIDVKDPGPVGHVADFRESDIATLDRAHSHVVTFEIKFKDGAHNDEVHIYIDGQKKKDGTTWEDYYRYDPEQAGSGNQVPTVDKLLFREGGTMNPTDADGGFLIDRVLLTSSGRTRKRTTPAPAPPQGAGAPGSIWRGGSLRRPPGRRCSRRATARSGPRPERRRASRAA